MWIDAWFVLDCMWPYLLILFIFLDHTDDVTFGLVVIGIFIATVLIGIIAGIVWLVYVKKLNYIYKELEKENNDNNDLGDRQWENIWLEHF